MSNKTLVYIGLGSNMDDPESQLDKAIKKIVSSDDFSMIMSSSYYRSSPVGYDQQDDFVNAVVRADTSLGAGELYTFLRRIEKKAGRARDPKNQNAPRPIDCDILLYGTSKINHTKLIVPHPRMTQRLFVMRPLLEISPHIEIPAVGSGKLILESLENSDIGKAQKIVKI